jgi:hypothetical protein
MDSQHLKKVIEDPELGEILALCHEPSHAWLKLKGFAWLHYQSKGKPVPEYLMAGINSGLSEDIVPNVIATYITNLEVADDRKSNNSWLQKLDRLVFIARGWLYAFMRDLVDGAFPDRPGE